MLDLFNEKLDGIKKIPSIIYSLTLISFLIYTGCEQKKTEDVTISKDTVQVKIEKHTPENTVSKDTTAVAIVPEVTIPDLKGKWTGTFDKRATTLRITEQEGKSFKGAITINYREVINQQVSGTVNEETMEFSMKDLLHSRYAGTYKGKLSEEVKKLSGTFTQNVDKTKFSFNLTKQ